MSGSVAIRLLCLAVAAQNMDQLVLDHFLDVGASGLQILAGIELGRCFVEELADGAGHGKTQIGVDVDLADSQLCSLAQLLFRDTDSVGHVTAIFIFTKS